ncbi:acyltransferase family protein [Noviherbaspirillum cavernae]|nr:acyltransferase family protein [Noviherbaspirillum cavernae]
MTGSTGKISYRPDVDGLRAIAVMSVVLFHLDFNALPGGFVGVDVFFVISGFLITKIIAAEIADGTFSFRQFYARRIRRILPVFFLVVAATIAAGSILLLPEDRNALLKSVQFALRFGANIYFSKSQGYFDLSSEEKPLLHLWSLSVEEQYYFIWPLLLVLLYATGRRLSGQAPQQKLIIGITAALTVAGFVFTQHAIETHAAKERLYFLLHARFGELMIGSLTAMLPPLPRDRKTLANVLAVCGMSGLLLALFAIDRHDAFPGYNALLPCLSAALLLHSGQSAHGEGTIASRMLGSRALVQIGLLSYSIYLWHWPILAFMRYVYGRYALPLTWSVAAVALMLALSCLSYLLLERKFKRMTMTFGRVVVAVFLVPVACLTVISIYGTGEATNAQNTQNEQLTTYGTDVCHGNFDMRCVRGDPETAPRILMFGDSHAASLNGFIDVVGRREHWSAMMVSASSCSPVFGFDEGVLPDYSREPCANLKKFVVDNLHKYDAVFIASYWPFHLGWTDTSADKDYVRKFKNTLETIAHSKPVYVFSDVPRLAITPARSAHFSTLRLHVERPQSREYARANETIRQIVLAVPNAHWIDIAAPLAGFDRFPDHGGLPMYLDAEHLNLHGSVALGERFSDAATILERTGPTQLSELR